MRAAILGVGSLGTILGASIASNGGDVVLIDANREHVDALNEKGATVEGPLELNGVPVRAITPEEMEGIYDLVIVMLKQTANEKALRHLLGYLNEDSIVCTLQNGLPERIVAGIVGEERMISGTVSMAAQMVEPGVSRMTTDMSRFEVEIASPNGKDTAALQKVRSFLSQGIRVHVAKNLVGTRWTKLLRNVTTSGVSAATGLTFGEMLDDDRATRIMVHAADECIRVANALGIALEQVNTAYDFYDLTFDDEAGRTRAMEEARRIWHPNRKAIASMLSDMRRGIPCEIDYINGEVCAYGRQKGILTPFNDRIVSIVKDFEAGKAELPNRSNIDRFAIPELK